MIGFSITDFMGLIPLMNKLKLRQGQAQTAIDCDFQGTDLRTFSDIKEITSVSLNQLPRSGFVFDEDRMFIFANDVEATYGPVRAEEEVDNRVFISYGFQEFPTYSTKRSGLPNLTDPYHGEPINWVKLGVIPGPVKPTVTVPSLLNGVGRIAAGSPSVLVVDENSPLNSSIGDSIATGSRIKITGADDDGWDRVNNNIYVVERPEEGEFGHESFLILNTLDTLDLYNPPYYGYTGGQYDPDSGKWSNGSPIYYNDAKNMLDEENLNANLNYFWSDEVNWAQEYEVSQVDDRFYVWTLVTELGEEGPPSLPSDLISVGDGQPVTVVTPTTIDDPGRTYTHKRIYRTVPQSSGEARYYFVDEIEISQEVYEDTKEAIELGEELQSLEWYPPPEELKGLTVLPNGVMAGFVDRTLYLSEPFQPHAWPSAYTKNMDNPIVGIAAFGQQLVVGTEENPYIGTLSDPLSMTFSKLDTVEPCISRRGMQSIGYGVVYPSPNGLIITTPAGSRNILTGVWDEKDWRALIDSHTDSFAVMHDQKYYLTFFDQPTVSSQTYIFDPTKDSLRISSISFDRVTGMMVDRDEDRMYFLTWRLFPFPTGAFVNAWNPDEEPENLTAQWKSRAFQMPFEVNLAAMQIFSDTTWPESASQIVVEVIVDDVSRYTMTITDGQIEFDVSGQITTLTGVSLKDPIRLPGGFLGIQWELKINTTEPIQSIFVAETVEQLRGAMMK